MEPRPARASLKKCHPATRPLARAPAFRRPGFTGQNEDRDLTLAALLAYALARVAK